MPIQMLCPRVAFAASLVVAFKALVWVGSLTGSLPLGRPRGVGFVWILRRLLHLRHGSDCSCHRLLLTDDVAQACEDECGDWGFMTDDQSGFACDGVR